MLSEGRGMKVYSHSSSNNNNNNNNKVKHFQVILEDDDDEEDALLMDEWLYIDSNSSDDEGDSTNQRVVFGDSSPNIVASTNAAGIQAQIPVSDSLTDQIPQVGGSSENETQIGLPSTVPCNKIADLQAPSTSAASPATVSPHCVTSEYSALHLPTSEISLAVPLHKINKSISNLVVGSQEEDAKGKCYNAAETNEGKTNSLYKRHKYTDGINKEKLVSNDEIEVIDVSNNESAVPLESKSDKILGQGTKYSSQYVGCPPCRLMTVKPQCPKPEDIILCEPSAASLPHSVAARQSFAKTAQEKSLLRKSDCFKLNVNDHSNKHNTDAVVVLSDDDDDDDIALIELENSKNTTNTTKSKKVCDSPYICIDLENSSVSEHRRRQKESKLSKNKVSSSAKENSERASVGSCIPSVPPCSLQSNGSPPHENGEWNNNNGDNCPPSVSVPSYNTSCVGNQQSSVLAEKDGQDLHNFAVNKKGLCQDPSSLAGTNRSQCGYNIITKVSPQRSCINSNRKDYQFLTSLIRENSAQLPVNLRSDNHQQPRRNLVLDDPVTSSNLNKEDGPQEPFELSKGRDTQESSNLNKGLDNYGPTNLMPEVPAVQENNETTGVLFSTADKDLLHKRLPPHHRPCNTAMNQDTSMRSTLQQTPSLTMSVRHTAPLNETSIHSLSHVSVSSSLDFIGKCGEEQAIHDSMTLSYPIPDSTVPDSSLGRGQKHLRSPTPPTSKKKICSAVKKISDSFGQIEDVKKHKRNSLVVECLEAVSKVSSILGSLGPIIESLLIKSTVKTVGGQNSIELFLETENIMTLELVNQTVCTEYTRNILESELKANIEKAWKMTNILLEEVNEMKSTEKYLGLDIDAIARATVGRDSNDVVIFVKQMLKYQGKKEGKATDIHSIFMAVAKKHCELAVMNMKKSISPNSGLASKKSPLIGLASKKSPLIGLASKKSPLIGFSRESEEKALSSVWKTVQDTELPSSSVYPQEEHQKQVKCSEVPLCSVKPQEKLHSPTPDSVNTGNSQGTEANTALATLLSIFPSTAASSSKGNDVIVDQQIQNITRSDPLPNTCTPLEGLCQSLAVKGNSKESTIKQMTNRTIEIFQNKSVTSINQQQSSPGLDPLQPLPLTCRNSGVCAHQNDLNPSHTEGSRTLSPVYDPDDYNNCGFQKSGTIAVIQSPIYDPDDKLSQQEMKDAPMKTGEQIGAKPQVTNLENLFDSKNMSEQRLVHNYKSTERKLGSCVELLSNETLYEHKKNYRVSPKKSVSQSQITVENQITLPQETDSRVHAQERDRMCWMSAGTYREAEASTFGRSEQLGVLHRDGGIVAENLVEKKTNETRVTRDSSPSKLCPNIYTKCHNISTNQNDHNLLQQSQSSRYKEFHQTLGISPGNKHNTIYNSSTQHPQSKQIPMECGYPNQSTAIAAKLHNSNQTLFLNNLQHSVSLANAGRLAGDSPSEHKLQNLDIEDVAALLVNFNSLTPMEQEMFNKYLTNLKVTSPETHGVVLKMVSEHKSI
nr:uncharacterized protein LOC123760866 isoform X2 [Procambarus clarkii]